jgi:hypothetical protein
MLTSLSLPFSEPSPKYSNSSMPTVTMMDVDAQDASEEGPLPQTEDVPVAAAESSEDIEELNESKMKEPSRKRAADSSASEHGWAEDTVKASANAISNLGQAYEMNSVPALPESRLIHHEGCAKDKGNDTECTAPYHYSCCPMCASELGKKDNYPKTVMWYKSTEKPVAIAEYTCAFDKRHGWHQEFPMDAAEKHMLEIEQWQKLQGGDIQIEQMAPAEQSDEKTPSTTSGYARGVDVPQIAGSVVKIE